MPLPQKFALDTETDIIEGFSLPRTVYIQICPADAVSEKEVVIKEGVDCYSKFFHTFEETRQNVDCHVFNLDYEFSRMHHEYLWCEGVDCPYTYVEGKPKKMQWALIGDDKAIYEVKFVNAYGKSLTITDDARRFPNTTMKSVAMSIYDAFPEWWGPITKEEVKMDIDESWYNGGWFTDEGEMGRVFRAYSVRDAFSQAMIMRYTLQSGMSQCLTSSSFGLKAAVITTYGDGNYQNPEYQKSKWAMKEFAKRYPPLCREMQDVVEDSLLGGFVWGEPGVHKGTFTHLDFSSSYPYEYYEGKMFYGRISVIRPGDFSFEPMLANENVMKWVKVSFEFDGIKDCGMPLISGNECYWELGSMPPKAAHAKMHKGTVKHKLFTMSYFEELQKHINIFDIKIEELWIAKKISGEFGGFIKMCYQGKEEEKAKNNGQNNVFSNEYKTLMNGGVHGKTITRTHRRKLTFDEYGNKVMVDSIDDPKYCALIGFTGMMNGRERLAKYCRMMKEAGFKVLMCDTDSMVVNTTEEMCRKILGDWFTDHDKGDMRNIGRFEPEKSKQTGAVEFHEFHCMGLKRYVEFNDDGSYRKSAFAGMANNLQKELLPDFPMDGSEYSWTQKGSVTDKYGKMIKTTNKSAKVESPWFEDLCCLTKQKGRANLFDVLREMNQDAEYEWGDME